MAKILGLDLGTNSIGWAVVDIENNNEFTLIEKGVRIFQEGVKIEKGIEGSKAAERTTYRSARRIKYRRKLRKIQLLGVLSENGYCPFLSKDELDSWRYKKVYPTNKSFLNWQKTNEIQLENPYFYRALLVEKKLNLNIEEDRFKIGRAFYHLAQRRGFLSNRMEGTKENDGTVIKSITEISTAKGDKTLGQYFYERYKKGEKIRDTYTHREEHYLEEFVRICEFQQLDNKFAEKVRKAIFYQRPLKSQKGLIGKCVFEPKKSRCSVSRPEFEEYRMLCFLNNIKIKTPSDENLRFLTDNEKEKLKPQFFRKSKDHFDFEDLVKQLAPKNQFKFYKSRDILPGNWLFNYSMNTTVSGCPISARLKDLFGENFMDIKFDYIREKDGKKSVIDIHDIWHVLFTYDSEEKLKEFARNRLNLDDIKIKEFQRIQLKKEYAALSLKAIRKILPFLREGLIYSHAVFIANMETAIPSEIWNNYTNRNIIKNEIYNIISNQTEDKQVVDIVNGIIKSSRIENSVWSNEAVEFFKKDLNSKIKNYYGIKTYNDFPEEKKIRIETYAFNLFKQQMMKNFGRGEFAAVQRIDERLKLFLTDNFNIDPILLKKIYHPSAIEVYQPPVRKNDGKLYLGSPMVSSIRNPMAMRALHQLRKLINELIRKELIDSNTKVNIEMARELMNANERKAYQNWQNDREKIRKEYALKIKQHLDVDKEPSDVDILKYQLWEEQNHKCIYTGKEINISDFLGSNPKFDIEHTIPRSISFDNSQSNKTLCENYFNRSVKKNRIPAALPNHGEIIERLENWKLKYEELEKQIQYAVRQAKGAGDKDSKDRAIQKRHKLKFEYDYWKNKYDRFVMEDVPEGFKNSQLVDTGIITKYSRMYLNTLFDKVYTVKGNTVADFRKLWGIQDEYEKKARVNHSHHCVDAITIACITKSNYENLAKFYHDWEELHVKGIDQLPPMNKPWKTFTEDIKAIQYEILVSHYTPDNLPKQSKKILRKKGRIQKNENGNPIYLKGDTVRGSLHQQTFYGAIEKTEVNKKGEPEKVIKYVVRKSLDVLDDSSVKNIVDDIVKEIVQNARIKEKDFIKELEIQKRKLAKAEENKVVQIQAEIDKLNKQVADLYTMPNKNGNPIPIKKVRIFQTSVTNPIHLKQQRDKSQKTSKPHKEFYYAANDSNYMMAIYEGKDEKGKVKRDFKLLNNLEAGEFFKYSVHKDLKEKNLENIRNVIPDKVSAGKIEIPLKAIIKTGTMVILWENSPDEVWDLTISEVDKRLYKVVGMSVNRIKSDVKTFEFGNIVLRHNKEASPATLLKIQDGEFKSDENYIAQRKLSHNQFNALVEGVDFSLSVLGEIKRLK
nr:CRISPR-associated protein Cas9 [uncultured bacterium]